MHCFLLGVTGFLGSHVAEGLLARGDRVTGLTSTPANTDDLEERGISPVVGDMRTPEEWIETALEADVVVQAAMLPLPTRPTRRYVRRTIEAERSLLSHLLPRLGSSTAFVYTSGIGIYGPADCVCGEAYPTEPFARSRKDLIAERMILDAAEDGVRATILRPAPIYGPGGLFHRFWGGRLAAGKRTMYPGSGDQTWSFISVWDCARAYLAAIDTPSQGEIYNVTDEEPVTLRRFLSELAEAAGAPQPIGLPKLLFRILGGPIFSPPLFSSFPASNDKIRNRLGFEPTHSTYREGAPALAKAYAGNPPAVVEE